MSHKCCSEGCEEKARYGKVNKETGRFEKQHCKNHKHDGEKGNSPKWKYRYQDFVTICVSCVGGAYKLITTEKEWIEGTKESGQYFKPKLLCPEGHSVTGTTIQHFLEAHGCSKCAGNLPWSEQYDRFVQNVIDRDQKAGWKMETTKEEWIEGTNKKGKEFKPKLECPEGHSVAGTTIGSFVRGHGCIHCGLGKSEKMMKDIVQKIFPNHTFQHNVRPDFLKYISGWNLELDMYCEELKLAFEYDGRQHRCYCERFHRTEQCFRKQQERDKWKNEKCKEMGIRLLRVPDFDGEKWIDCHNKENMEKYIKELCIEFFLKELKM